MPLPLLLTCLAAGAGTVGIGAGIHGGVKMNSAKDTMKEAQVKQEQAIARFEARNASITECMDRIGRQELEILNSFEEFSDMIEKIQGRPEFKQYRTEGICLPAYKAEELKKVSAGAGLVLGGIGGAAAGTAGGFAAAGAVTSAVMTFGTASTGTAISTLSGAAAVNATLAALGGGSVAAGGGGMALGSAVLGGATLGVGILVGGIIFHVTGTKLSDKAEEAYKQAERTESEICQILTYFDKLEVAVKPFQTALSAVESQYRRRLSKLHQIVMFAGKTNWSEFTREEKQMTENAVLLTGLLYQMCQTELVLKSDEENGINSVNEREISKAVSEANQVLQKEFRKV